MLYTDVEAHLLELLPRLAQQGDFHILEMGCALTHLHLLIENAPWADLLIIIRSIQAETSDSILQRFPQIAIDLKLQFIWDTGFHYERHSEKSVTTVRRYIRDQKQHHSLE